MIFNNARDLIEGFERLDKVSIWVSLDTFNHHYIDVASMANAIRNHIKKYNLHMQSVQRGDKVYITKHIGVVPPPLYFSKRMNQNV